MLIVDETYNAIYLFTGTIARKEVAPKKISTNCKCKMAGETKPTYKREKCTHGQIMDMISCPWTADEQRNIIEHEQSHGCHRFQERRAQIKG